jgi:hypothetical protein
MASAQVAPRSAEAFGIASDAEPDSHCTFFSASSTSSDAGIGGSHAARDRAIPTASATALSLRKMCPSFFTGLILNQRMERDHN